MTAVTAGPSARAPLDRPFVDRDDAVDAIDGLLARAGDGGGALVLTGEAGVGKTTLLAYAGDLAERRGVRVLRAGGAEFEAEVTYAGLNQALLGLSSELAELPQSGRQSLAVALALADGNPPSPLAVANAVLAVLGLAARVRPLLLMVDDLQWLDRASAVVLGLVARRIGAAPAVLLGASRSGWESFFDARGLPTHPLQPLDEDAATDLLRRRHPTLAPRLTLRVLAEARGNPLALIEIPAALTARQRAGLDPVADVLTVDGRLLSTFAGRIGSVPRRARPLLLRIALEGTGDRTVLGAGDGREGMAALERAGLVQVDDLLGTVTFRHPLVRSAVVTLSTHEERRTAHRELAELLRDQPERHARHLANATTGTDSGVADLLEATAHQILRRGDAVGAVSMMLRSADLTPHGELRGRRLSLAAYVGADVTGDLRRVAELLATARADAPTVRGTHALQAAVASAYAMLNGDSDITTAHHLLVRALDESARSAAGTPSAQETEVVTDALRILLAICQWALQEDLWAPFYRALDRSPASVSDHLYLESQLVGNTVCSDPEALRLLDDTIAGLDQQTDLVHIERTARVASYVDRITPCREPLWRVVADGRRGGAVASGLAAMAHLCLDSFRLGRWEEVRQLAAEGVEVCTERGYGLNVWWFRLYQAVIAACTGEEESVAELTDQILRWATPRGLRGVQCFAWQARALAALGRRDFEEAYRNAAQISRPGQLASHTAYALIVLPDLVEAALRTGREAEARAHVAAMLEHRVARLSPRLALLVAGCVAAVADDEDAPGLYEVAVTTIGAEQWPFDLARIRLGYGERLRRVRRTTEAREQLAAARDTFERIGARPWADRAEGELRAAGLPGAPAGGGRPTLTAQEQQIAELAASGLSNKQIAARLFLSPRTVGGHLAHVFPKLGISSRAGLRDALSFSPGGSAGPT